MTRTNTHYLPLIATAVGIVVVGGGLLRFLSKQPMPSGTTVMASAASATHADSTPHSTNVQSFGDYHVEAQMSDSGAVTIFLYGTKEKQLMPISTLGWDLGMGMEAEVVIPGEDAVPVKLKPRPYPGEPTGQSSRFIGAFARRVDQSMVGLSLTIPLNGQTYRVQWRPENLQSGIFSGETDPGMPVAVASDTANKLFLTPGGLYTDADIKANGRMTASQKYGHQMSSHNAHPRPGDRTCPITDTVANPKFAWVAGGKTYLFCCPPCIEEFVKRAKESPQTIKMPEEYVQPSQ